MSTRFRTLLALAAAGAFLLAGRAAGEGSGGNALGVLNAFLAQAAATEPAYRTDLKAGRGQGSPDTGRCSGYGPILGPFTYRPKVYSELGPAERAALLRDPAFRSYLLGMSRPPVETRSAPASGPRSDLPSFALSPGELLRRRTFVVSLPRP